MKKTTKGSYYDVHNGLKFEVWQYPTWGGELVWGYAYEWETIWSEPSDTFRTKKAAERVARQEIDTLLKEWNTKRAERLQGK